MGTHDNISHNKFPKQGSFLNRRVEVCFHYDTTHRELGTIVRDDTEEPGIGLIKLDNNRYVLMTECQYSLLPQKETLA